MYLKHKLIGVVLRVVLNYKSKIIYPKTGVKG